MNKTRLEHHRFRVALKALIQILDVPMKILHSREFVCEGRGELMNGSYNIGSASGPLLTTRYVYYNPLITETVVNNLQHCCGFTRLIRTI